MFILLSVLAFLFSLPDQQERSRRIFHGRQRRVNGEEGIRVGGRTRRGEGSRVSVALVAVSCTTCMWSIPSSPPCTSLMRARLAAAFRCAVSLEAELGLCNGGGGDGNGTSIPRMPSSHYTGPAAMDDNARTLFILTDLPSVQSWPCRTIPIHLHPSRTHHGRRRHQH